MTRKELVIQLANCPEVKSQKAASAILNHLEATLTAAFTEGGSVTISSTFGTLKPLTRSGKAPGTGKPYTTKSVKFSPSAALKRALN